MKNIIVLAIAFASLTGCATAQMESRLDSLERENINLRRANALYAQQQAKATTVVAPGQQAVVPAPGAGQRVTITSPVEKVSPEIDPSQQVITTSTVTTFAEANPGAYQCFMDRNPGFGGEWIKVPNKSRRRWVSLTLNSQPVIVLRPVPGGWQPYTAKPGVTVLPAGKACYIWAPQGRMKADGDLENYQLEADAYYPSFVNGWRVLLSEKRSGFFPARDARSLSQFVLSDRGLTVFNWLEDPDFE